MSDEELVPAAAAFKPRSDQPAPIVRITEREESMALAREVGLPDNVLGVGLYRYLLHSPPIAKTVDYIKEYLCGQSDLDPLLREMAILRVCWLTGCEYVWCHHIAPRRSAHLVFPEGEDAPGKSMLDPDDPQLTELQRCALRLVDDIVLGDRVAESTTKALEASLPSVQHRLDLVFAITYYLALAKTAVAVGIPVEDYYEPWCGIDMKPRPTSV